MTKEFNYELVYKAHAAKMLELMYQNTLSTMSYEKTKTFSEMLAVASMANKVARNQLTLTAALLHTDIEGLVAMSVQSGLSSECPGHKEDAIARARQLVDAAYKTGKYTSTFTLKNYTLAKSVAGDELLEELYAADGVTITDLERRENARRENATKPAPASPPNEKGNATPATPEQEDAVESLLKGIFGKNFTIYRHTRP